MNAKTRIAPIVIALAAMAGCRSEGDIVVEEGVGISALRSVCPAVGVPDYTGDITTFRSAARTQADLDVTASITNVRATCDDTGAQVQSVATFDVYARRADARGSRTVQLPYFSTVVQGGRAVVSKEVGTVTLTFADGEERAQASGQAGASIDRAAATLPDEIRDRITRRRQAGDADAAIDPLTEPEVRTALARATFELLVGFQLTEDQLAYNATR
jgi:hypothetical protein